MIDIGEVEVVKETGTEGYALDGKQATDGLNNDVPFGISVRGEQVANVEPRATEEMEEVERCLKMEQEGMQFGYPKANESLREYLWRCHKRNSDMLLCLRCSIRLCRRVAEDYEIWHRTKTERNWRKENQLQKVYPKPGENLLGFIVRCYKYEIECLMCPRCGAVYNRELAEAFERIPSNQGWEGMELDLCYDDNWRCAKDNVLFLKRQENDRVLMLLARLNKDLDEVRGRVLGKVPLPTLRETFAEIRREEAQQGIMMGKTPRNFESEGSVLATRNLDEGRRSYKVPWCDHCKREWHTRETCWKLKGKPPNWKKKSGSAFQASNSDQGQQPPPSQFPLTMEQLDRLYKLLESPTPSFSIATKGNFAFLSVNLATRNLDEGRRSYKVPWCDHYKREWHTRETCWKLKGKPHNWKKKSGSAFQASNSDQGQQPPPSQFPLTMEQLDKLYKLLPQCQQLVVIRSYTSVTLFRMS
ncbi:hypothetical protein KIW84_062607 [Lathyrus oleraceus]|uniref:Uncharacterized protein n=1 Tax=Pisum sativum TaxID=3888 RepID=A0A9D4W804_PEA|nr:hypothetical protein KIW84_062607 [Pisum sativum]